VHASIEAFHLSKAMREVLGNEFVDLYTDLKENEYREFQERITPWEREVLMLNV
jgi:glutamine synthetase